MAELLDGSIVSLVHVCVVRALQTPRRCIRVTNADECGRVLAWVAAPITPDPGSAGNNTSRLSRDWSNIVPFHAMLRDLQLWQEGSEFFLEWFDVGRYKRRAVASALQTRTSVERGYP